MDALELTGLLLVLAALLTYCNLRFLHLPHPMGTLILALGLSSGLILLDHLSLPLGNALKEAVAEIDFSHTVLRWMLGFLLFAGGLTMHLNEVLSEKRRVFGLALLGTMLFILLAGMATGGILPRLGLPVTLLGCLTFAALISPTNPVAIIDFLASPQVPRRVKTTLAAESMFSAGIVAVAFFVLADAAMGHQQLSFGHATWTLLFENGGAILAGLCIGYLSLWLMRQVDHAEFAVLTALAAVVGGYALSDRLGICGPVTVACAGICLGNAPKSLRITTETKESLARFWEPVVYGLNTMLFVLLGLEMLVIQADERLSYVAVAVLLVWPILLLVRLVSVWVVARVERWHQGMSLPELTALTWGGPRGGVSLALAMVLPPGPERDCWIAVVYVIVLLSIVVQGLTVNRLIPLLDGADATSRYPERILNSPTTSA